MKEPQVTSKIVTALNGVDSCYAKKRHSGKFQSGEPDITGCYMGQAFYVETKMRDGALTLLQASMLENWRKAGAKTFIAIYHPADKTLKIIEPDDSEAWDEFVGSGNMKILYEESVSPKATFHNFDFQRWANEHVFGK